ncbi:MAG: lipoyl(octanoyl) transferase LipB [Arenicella sp.]|jgi:lipoyl(octanoyl) transferase|nr:lipoyl(octanoyl) transferase LipB [Arenicella sp.]HAU67430.1 octanoyltransferase [Gammaproteobacteria bacterium]
MQSETATSDPKSNSTEAAVDAIRVHNIGVQAYLQTQQRMQARAAMDRASRSNQIWLLEHSAVYTQGTSCQQQTLLPSDIPVVKSDRGGQITYHGPGQIVMYPLLNLKELGLGVKSLVNTLEQAAIDVLHESKIDAKRRKSAPGVYVDSAKIAALGLRVKNGMSYHGLSFNYAMDLTPFSNIDPCGFKGLEVTQFKDQVATGLFDDAHKEALAFALAERFINLLKQRTHN